MVEGIAVALDLLHPGVAPALDLLLPGLVLGGAPGVVQASAGLDGLLGGSPPLLPCLALGLDLLQPLGQGIRVIGEGLNGLTGCLRWGLSLGRRGVAVLAPLTWTSAEAEDTKGGDQEASVLGHGFQWRRVAG